MFVFLSGLFSGATAGIVGVALFLHGLGLDQAVLWGLVALFTLSSISLPLFLIAEQIQKLQETIQDKKE